MVDTSLRGVQALLLSPTKELAKCDYINMQANACIGGMSNGEDIRKLEYGVHVVSESPGRVIDMIKRGTFQTRSGDILKPDLLFSLMDD